MPVCQLCQTFYVRPQTFATLFSRGGLCVLCETYQCQELSCSVLPIDQTTVELYSFGHPDHPALTQKAFNHFYCHNMAEVVFLETDWFTQPIVFWLMARLFAPFRLFSYEKQAYLLETVFGTKQ